MLGVIVVIYCVEGVIEKIFHFEGVYVVIVGGTDIGLGIVILLSLLSSSVTI